MSNDLLMAIICTGILLLTAKCEVLFIGWVMR